MKVIIHSRNATLISALVAKTRFVVVAQTSDVIKLQDNLVKNRPKIVFYDYSESIESSIIEMGRIFHKVIRFIQVQGNWSQISKTVLDALHAKDDQEWIADCPEQRVIMVDPAYNTFERPINGVESIDHEQAIIRLKILLTNSLRNHAKATQYRKALLSLQDDEKSEISYRIVHRSFKAAAYAREQVSRHIGYLCHYLPGVDSEALPPPADQPTLIRYLHHVATLEAEYAIVCLCTFGFQSEIEQAALWMIGWRFSGESDEVLTGSSLSMLGIVTLFENISTAHQTVINWFLSGGVSQEVDSQYRSIQRSFRIFSDFWMLGDLMNHPEQVEEIVREVLEQPNSPVPDELLCPTFSHFIQVTDKVRIKH